jgi:dipeptidyl-peptidase 4
MKVYVFAGLIIVAGLSEVVGQPLSIDRIFSSPSLAGITTQHPRWAPDGRSIAYLRREATEVELWLYDPGKKSSARLVKEEDILSGGEVLTPEEQMLRERTRQPGSGIRAFFWSPSGKQIYIPAGGEVYSIDVATRKIKKITETGGKVYDPKISPSGDRLAFVLDGEVTVQTLSSNQRSALTTGATEKIRHGISEYIAQEEMGRTSGYWWSPDGSAIAYLRVDNTPLRVFHIPDYLLPYSDARPQEYAKAGESNSLVRIGVVSSSGGETTWLPFEGNDDRYIARVDWLPSSRKIAVQTQSRNQDSLDLWLYDLSLRSSVLILRERNPRWVSLHDHLTFLVDGSFLWSSEEDGFRHLYLYGSSGQLRTRLTRGSWDVDKLAGVDEKVGRVYFTATKKSPLERHLYSCTLDGTNLTRISTSDGWHEITMSPDRKRYVDLYSNVNRPPLLALMSVSGSDATLIEKNDTRELHSFNLSPIEFFTLPDIEKKDSLYGFLIKPTAFDSSRKYPVILYVYGGPTSQVVTHRWGAGGGTERFLWHRMMAQQGYVVGAVDGRGTPGRGRAFQDVVYRQLGKAELEDQVHAARYFSRFPFVDSTRMMIWGKSYGGYMTCEAMFSTSGLFKLGIAVAPVTDWKNYDTHYTERYMELPRENPGGYLQCSPLYAAQGLQGKFLLIHGAVDDNVHFQDSMLLADALQKANKQFDFMPYPRSTHAFSGSDVGRHLYSLLTRYIVENL